MGETPKQSCILPYFGNRQKKIKTERINDEKFFSFFESYHNQSNISQTHRRLLHEPNAVLLPRQRSGQVSARKPVRPGCESVRGLRVNEDRDLQASGREYPWSIGRHPNPFKTPKGTRLYHLTSYH